MRKFATIFRSGCAIACLTTFAYFQAPVDANAQFVADWEARNTIKHTDVDSLFASDWSGNSRTVIGGFDLDKDGKQEMILTDYGGMTVRVFEYDVVNDVFEEVWKAPPDTSGNNKRPGSNPRIVTISDFDGDDKMEITFPFATDASGWYIYEWDGVTGSDNYGTVYSSLFTAEADTCCPGGSGYRADHDAVSVMDVDGDDKQEFIVHARRGSPRGTLICSVDGDIEHNAGGAGFESWNTEFWTNRSDYGGGSPLHSIPADLDGDGTYEIVHHTWNNFNFYNVDVLGADSYQAPDVA
ncbi:MAG: hypothetical protein ACE5I1_14605, partial [bacterium]